MVLRPVHVHASDLELHVLAQLTIERAERLVHQQSVGLDHDGAGERDALLLAARELPNAAVFETCETDHFERVRDPLPDLVTRAALDLKTVGDVLPDCHVREQRVALKHHSHVARARGQFGYVTVVDEETALSRRKVSRTDVQERRLAGARGAEQRQEFALGNIEIDRLERHYSAERSGNSGKTQGAHPFTCERPDGLPRLRRAPERS